MDPESRRSDPESLDPDLWEPRGSNPLGPPGPELCVPGTLRVVSDCGQIGPLINPSWDWTHGPLSDTFDHHEAGQSLKDPATGSRTEKDRY